MPWRLLKEKPRIPWHNWKTIWITKPGRKDKFLLNTRKSFNNTTFKGGQEKIWNFMKKSWKRKFRNWRTGWPSKNLKYKRKFKKNMRKLGSMMRSCGEEMPSCKGRTSFRNRKYNSSNNKSITEDNKTNLFPPKVPKASSMILVQWRFLRSPASIRKVG